ncbi:MAG: carbohydrate binding family 9 domain-containing protein [Prolixibacteraceae bacterium]|nr:carbohydrate binding family 9 domain-containing protein [Prolixibacteraceae bacterium]
MIKKILLACLTALIIQGISAQEAQKQNATYNSDYILNIKKAKSVINLDGVIDEPDWDAAQVAGDFRRVLPIDTGYAYQQSEILMTYDDKALYLAMIFYDTIPGKRIMESYRRDFSFNNNDNLLVFFDTFLDQTNGFSFGISASGAKWDGTMSDGSLVSLDWDCKWESKTKHYPDKWVAEMRIPFKSVRYPSGSKTWNGNFSRLDLKSNEKSAWAPVPRQFPTASLAYTGVLNFEEPLPKPKMMFSLIPYVFGGFSNDYETDKGAQWKKDFGFDAKVGLTSSMNLDLTYNPDFAQVEVDQQVTNIDRFELFFPEKRQFFLENSDLFSGFGNRSATPFFSRRIGLDAPVIGGARLSGKIGKNWRIGFMNMTTKKTEDHLSRNFTVFSLQKKVFARSNFGFIFINKEYLNQPAGSEMFNRVASIDYNLASKDNIWSGKYYYHRSFRPGNPDKQYSQGASLGYSTKNIQAHIFERSVGENFLAETGYVTRTGYHFISPDFKYLFVPNKKVVSHGLNLESDLYFNNDFEKIEHENTISYQFEFQDRSALSVGYKDFYVELQDDFDPTHVSNTVLPAGSSYNFGGVFINYQSTRKTLFNWQAESASGKFYNGNISYIDGQLGYRYQPYINLAVNFNYTDMKLPQPFEHTKFWLIGPKLDLTFTDKTFLSTFVQYNEQMDNMNINIRFQWRYQPVSDLFVVYTDNYIPGDWTSKNRALVLKLTYWLN